MMWSHLIATRLYCFICRPDDLRAIFNPYGEIGDVSVLHVAILLRFIFGQMPAQIYIPRDHVTGSSRGFGFVRYVREADADEAIHWENHRELNGQPMLLERATARPLSRPSAGYVYNGLPLAYGGGYGDRRGPPPAYNARYGDRRGPFAYGGGYDDPRGLPPAYNARYGDRRGPFAYGGGYDDPRGPPPAYHARDGDRRGPSAYGWGGRFVGDPPAERETYRYRDPHLNAPLGSRRRSRSRSRSRSRDRDSPRSRSRTGDNSDTSAAAARLSEIGSEREPGTESEAEESGEADAIMLEDNRQGPPPPPVTHSEQPTRASMSPQRTSLYRVLFRSSHNVCLQLIGFKRDQMV
jgi:RNA recognition motif-containing protein